VQFLINKAVFQSALKKCGSTVSRRDAIPVLQNFLIQADETEVRIVGTDLELGLVARILVVDVKEQGKITVPADKLQSMVNEAEDGDVDFTVVDGTDIELKAGPTVWHIKGMSSDDYPDVPVYDSKEALDIKREPLLSAIRRVQRAASDDEQRLQLMMLRFMNGKVYASDGHRLHIADIPSEELDMSLPKLAVNELIALLDRSEAAKISVQITENQLLFKIGNEVFSSGKLQADFPDVEKMIVKPTDQNEQELKVDRQSLLTALRRVRITADEKTQAVILDVNGSGKAVLSASDETGNDATETIDAAWNGEEERSVGFNHRYLEDLLNSHDPVKSITFMLAPDTKHRKAPIKVESEGLTTIVLPLRVDASN